ncbi:hypothetical protein H6F89_04095 [Cyanobacteria bacterium FACHB-63]|nr:hypothetical protein [Cyanobacteria bacterium FACHB-63]
MLNRTFLDQFAETLMVSGMGTSALLILLTNTIRPHPQLATFGTFTGCMCAVGYWELNRKTNTKQLQAERDRFQQKASQAEAALNQAQTRLEESLKQSRNDYEQKLAELHAQIRTDANLQTKYSEVKKAFEQRATELNEALAESAKLRSQIETFEGVRSDWVQKFDCMILEHQQEVEKLYAKINALKLENIQYKAQFSSIDETAKLRAESELYRVENKLRDLNQEYTKVATLYNSAVADLKRINTEYVAEFSELSEAVNKGIPSAFDHLLDARDQELMRLFGHLNELMKPHYFDEIGEFVRANRLIRALWESEEPICLDASEIVPYSDNTGFDVYLSLRDRKIRGQATIDALNDRGNEFSVLCGCIKDLKFEYDRINPHRIKTAMVFRKPPKTDTKATIDKLWIPAEQFAAKVPKLLKKPMTRIMGATGEGKGIVVNLLLAIEASQESPCLVRLHDPMDHSEEDYWQIPKASKGTAQTAKAVKAFVAEFNQRLEHGIAQPRTLDVFDELDIVAERDSSVNKSMLSCAKGMRHNGMRAYVIGQSPSAGKKGFEWADFDNFNCIYFGAAIITVIDKSPVLASRKEALRKEYDKLKEYCDRQNEELGLEGWNEYRVGLIVTGGKAYFFELPNADSIPCDWSKLTQQPTEELKTSETIKSAFCCPNCNSDDTKDRSGRKKLANQLTRYYRICHACRHKFEVDL